MADEARHDQALTPDEIRSRLSPFEVGSAELEILVELLDSREKLDSVYDSLRQLSATRLGDTVTNCNRNWPSFSGEGSLLLIAQGVMGMEILHPVFESARARFELAGTQFAEIFRRAMSNRPAQTLRVSDNRTLSTYRAGEVVMQQFDLTRMTEEERPFWAAFARKMVKDALAGRVDDTFPIERDLGAWAMFAAEISAPKMTFHGSFYNRQEEARVMIRDHLLPVLDKDVLVRVWTPGAPLPADLAPDKFHILYNSRTATGPIALTEGFPLVGKNGEIIGILVGNILHIVGNPLAESNARLEQVFIAAGRELMLAEEDDPQEVMESRFVKETMDQFTSLRRSAQVREVDIAESERRLHESYRTNREFEAEYALRGTNALQILGREFDVQARGILNIEKIERLEVTENEMIVTTKSIQCLDDRTRRMHELGVYKIHIPLQGHANVRFFNQNRQVRGMHAPHVGAEGNPCFGNTATLFPQLIKDRDYVSLVELAIAFLESANTSDGWGQHIASWPVAATPRAPGGVGDGRW